MRNPWSASIASLAARFVDARRRDAFADGRHAVIAWRLGTGNFAIVANKG
jgi:hypothetical protein